MEQPETIFNYESGAEALRRVEDGRGLIVIDEQNRVLGLISAADLWPRRRPQARPAAVGGMATPFGVYLTSGTVTGGVSKWALAATGAVMSLMMFAAALCARPLIGWLDASKLPDAVQTGIYSSFVFALFFAIMRVAPLSGTHGAEHQVVNAIERDEELRPEIVRRMPRVHPRCGTNLTVGALIFLTVWNFDWIPLPEIRLLLAAIATFALWRRLGSLLQYYVTTKRPSDKQLEGGIVAGKMLLERYVVAKSTHASVWQRIWNSGLFQLLAGAIATTLLLSGLGLLFHLDITRLVS
jgi:hypothetical protein